jgi:tetratricopeptide (TPR) repeat protein
MEATMRRTLYFAGLGYLAICGMLVLRKRQRPYVPEAAVIGTTGSATADSWWARTKARCNAVEVELAHRMTPPPKTFDGQSYSAACYALAGKIDSARAIIDRLPQGERYRAAGVVFNVAHPIADAGDNRSAGPIMELVIEYWPNHYMALYHAGMAEYGLGQAELARKNLTAFLANYHADDGWTRSARETLVRLGDDDQQ